MSLIPSPTEERRFLEHASDQHIDEREVSKLKELAIERATRAAQLWKRLKPASMHIEVTPFHKRAILPTSADHIREIEQSLDELATTLGSKVPWVLTGGLAIPISTGSFYRRHTDIDIGIHRDDVERLDFEARASGYALFIRQLTFTIPRLKRKMDVYTSFRSADQRTTERRHYCLRRLDPLRTSPRVHQLTDTIDVFTYHFERDMLVLDHNGLTVPLLLAEDMHYITKSGNRISLHNPVVLARIKSLGWSDVDALDARVLAEHLSTIERTNQHQSMPLTQ